MASYWLSATFVYLKITDLKMNNFKEVAPVIVNPYITLQVRILF